jgi:two-component system, OmpR family, phosphate regulon sensor histidine kinase PhoR
MKNGADPVSVLVVDDEQGIRQGSKRIIDRMGCRALTAKTGEEGLEIVEREAVDIVLLDLKMPGMDGMEVLHTLQEKFPQVLVIVITGFATIETAIEAMKKGAYDFIPKPFEPDQLRIVVNRASELVHLETEARRLQLERTRTLADLGAEKSRIHTIIHSLPNGILVTNAQGMVVLINPAFVRQMGLPDGMTMGRPVQDYLGDEGLLRLVMEVSQGRHVDFDDIPPYEFSTGSEKFLQARTRPVLGDRHECLGAVITLQDITAMKVIDRLKSEFVAKVSHELRSPLSTIHEQLAVVLSDMVGQVSSSDTHLLSRAKEKTQGLISLIGDLLDLSRIESGAVCETPKPVILEELLENIIDFLGTRAAAKHQSLTLTRPKEPLPAVKADPLALESIFGNLITNAINYTPENGRIEVHISQAGINLQVQVIDNGFGIEARHLEKIFERFYRVKTEKTRYITGTGLGLPIVKGLIDSLGGRISVESMPDEGSTFTILLPAVSKED